MDLTRENLAQHNASQNSFDPILGAMDRMNQSSLARLLPSFKSIVSRASHASLYTFDINLQGNQDRITPWKDTGVNGPLFIVNLSPDPQTEDPRFALAILNRAGLENFVIEITKPDTISLESPFIFLQYHYFPSDVLDAGESAKGKFYGYETQATDKAGDRPYSNAIWGIWVYDQGSTSGDRERIYYSLTHCAEQSEMQRNRDNAEAKRRREHAYFTSMVNGTIPPDELRLLEAEHGPLSHQKLAWLAERSLESSEYAAKSRDPSRLAQGLQQPAAQHLFMIPQTGMQMWHNEKEAKRVAETYKGMQWDYSHSGGF